MLKLVYYMAKEKCMAKVNATLFFLARDKLCSAGGGIGTISDVC